MNKSLFFFAQLFVLFSIQNNNVFSQKAELYIEFRIEKPVFVTGEPIIFNFTITNSGNQYAAFPYGCSLFFDIYQQLNLTNDKGSEYKYNGIMISCIGGSQILKSMDTEENEIFGNAMDLLFGYGDVSKKNITHLRYLQEGKYTLNFKTMLNGAIFVHSNEIKFEIKQPTEKDRYDKYSEIDSIDNKRMKFENLRKFIHDFPESPYSGILLEQYSLLMDYNVNSLADMLNDFELYFNKNTNSWTIGNFIRYCSYTIGKAKDEDEMISYLVKIMNKYPGSKLSIAAYNLLSKVIPNEIYLKGLKY